MQIETSAFPLADKAATALINAGASDGNTTHTPTTVTAIASLKLIPLKLASMLDLEGFLY